MTMIRLFLRGRPCERITHVKLTFSLTYFPRRFVDWRILPLLALLYSFALIDRINLGAARTAGMGRDLVCQALLGLIDHSDHTLHRNSPSAIGIASLLAYILYLISFCEAFISSYACHSDHRLMFV